MIPTLTVKQLQDRINANADFFLLDVRQPEEHQAFRIREGLLIPLGELTSRVAELESQRGREIVIYCRSGNRSGQATHYLNQLGFNCINLQGGTLAWQADAKERHEN